MPSNDPGRQPTDLDAALEAEIQDALGDMTVEDMLDLGDRPRRPGRGRATRETRPGTIASIHGDDVFVEFGPKAQGVCPLRQFEEKPEIGATMDFTIERLDADDGLLILSRDGAIQTAAWESLEIGQIIEARCTGTNKGGLDMEVANHRAFMPAGQVDIRHIEDLGIFVGEKLPCEVIELDRQRGRIILSRKAMLLVEQAERREKLLQTLDVGQRTQAVITSVQPYGAFADIGGMDGLIHVSELSWKHVDHPGAVVTVGDKVTVQVLDVDFDRERISLSLKATQQDPWQEFAGTHEVGQLVYGRVTKLVPFGAFVQVGDGIEGLVHISEMSAHHVDAPEQVVTPGEELWVKIIDLDLARRRISLSIKQAAEGGELAEEYRQHFEIDEHGNWTAGQDDAEREAAWAEYYQENPDEAPVAEGDAPAEEA